MKPIPQRKLNMRKSNGEIVESSENDPCSSASAASSRPISRASTTASMHSLINGETDSRGGKMTPALQAFKFYFNAFSKSLNSRININFLDKTAVEVAVGNNILYLNPIEILLRKLHSNEFYLAKFKFKLGRSENDGDILPNFSSKNNNFKTGSFKECLRLVQIKPNLTVNEHFKGNDFIKTFATNISKNLDGAKISKITAFNIFGNSISMDDILFETEIVENIDPSNIKIAKEARISLIECSNYESSFEINEIKNILKSFFNINQNFHQNDIFSIQTEINGKFLNLFFEISFPLVNKLDHEEVIEPYFIVNASTTIYQQPKKRRFFLNNLTDTNNFIPKNLIELTQRMTKLYRSQMNGSNQNEKREKTENQGLNQAPIISILAGTPGCGFERIINLLADNLCLDLIKIDCYDFWNIEGKSVDKLLDATIEKIKQSSPSLIVIEKVKALTDASPNNLEAGNKTLDRLCKSLTDLPEQLAIIFTCNQSDLANLPKPLAQLIHFEFIIPDLTENNRMDFIEKWKIHQPIEMENEKFAALTRGFVLSELDQLKTISNQLRILTQQKIITTSIIEKAVDSRNKSFSNSIGAPKIPTVKWRDVGGLEDVKKAISESLKANLKINNSNSNLKRSGIVLYGPPGCGKTLIAKAVANEFNITFLSVKGPELLNQYVGQSEQNLRTIFEKARLASPSIIFFDEMDSLAPNRGNAGDSGGVMDRMVSQLLTELDTLHSKQNCNVFVMAATNRPDLLDPCLLTPGRFDKSIHVQPAKDLNSKLRILEPVCRKMTLENGLTPEIIASKCPEIMSGADLTSLMQKSAMIALSKVIYGIENSGLVGEKLREVIGTAEVIVKLEHVRETLKEFNASLSENDVAKYQQLEQEL